MNKVYPEDCLLDSVHTTSEIECTKCEKTDEVEDDHVDALKYFFDQGWRATKAHTYCPSCAAIYLKPRPKKKKK
jgi:hypothetical protein